METNIVSYFDGDIVELHYWLKNQTHSMDAFVQNKCDYEFLHVIDGIAKIFDLEVIIETEPLGNGGIKRWFRIIYDIENKKAAITGVIVLTLAVGVFTTPITTALSEITKQLVEKIFEDKKIKELEEEKLKEEIKNLKLDSELKAIQISENKNIAKRKSTFYEVLEKYSNAEQISITIENKDKNPISDEIVIHRNNYKEYIIISDYLDPIQDETALIEIISPVLKKGDYKWRGIYKGEILSFNMKSNEFKTLVQTGLEFKNGSSINCFLEIERKIDTKGDEKILNYNIIRHC
ncbi:hypothetical protein EZS27_028680 [termite gut metagenome]|uniref:Uncharacterized protein n=1 Tax=termite gut metagenome TaxID=433724 RepID=A0A5J4QL56_9ZZZZ